MSLFRQRDDKVFRRRLRLRVKRGYARYGERDFPWHHNRGVSGFRLILVTVLLAALVLGTTGGVAAVAGYVYYDTQLPSVDLVFDSPMYQTTLVYDRDGNLLFEIRDPDRGHRILTPLSQMPQHLIEATIAAEDPSFFQNPGVDFQAIGRAVYQNVQGGGIVSGASTLTMQLVRNKLMSEEERADQSMARKIKEAVRAVNLSLTYPKNDILEMYLNEVYYGHQAYGVQAAALTYFGKPVSELSLAEAAVIAGLPQAPSEYDPYINPELAVRRQHYVLDRMVEFGFLSEEEAERAKDEPIILGQIENHFDEAPHFSQYVHQLLLERFGYEQVYYGGLRVITSIDLELQRLATDIARAHIEQIRSSRAGNAALVAIDPKTGEVLAMVGSVDFYDESIDGQVNMAVAPRQPGSSIKPFTYVTAFEKLGYVPATLVNDRPVSFSRGPGLPPYTPMNWNLQFNGIVPLRAALGASMNIPAVELLAQIGVPALIDTAHRMGITTINEPPETYGLALTLGAAEVRLLDQTFAYSGFANNGKLVGAAVPPERQRPGHAVREPVIISKVTNYRGEVLYEHTPQEPVQVVPAEYAYMITSSLADDSARVLTYGLNSYLKLSRPGAAKTGTTEFRQDAWTVGYTPDLVAGVWVGNADNTPMLDVAGVSGAGKIWHDFMEAALRDTPPSDFEVPPNIRFGNVCGRYDVYVEGRTPVCSVDSVSVSPTPTATPSQVESAPTPAPGAGN